MSRQFNTISLTGKRGDEKVAEGIRETARGEVPVSSMPVETSVVRESLDPPREGADRLLVATQVG